jgi:hypothetical protein
MQQERFSFVILVQLHPAIVCPHRSSCTQQPHRNASEQMTALAVCKQQTERGPAPLGRVWPYASYASKLPLATSCGE